MLRRILCLDVGDKKIGVAVSDPFGKTALPLETYPRQTFKKDCGTIARLAEEYDAGTIVIGLPLDLENREGPQAKKVRFFEAGLKKFLEQNHFAIIMEVWDESLSSKEAEAILLEADLSRKKRRKAIDKLAATLILQSYLDSKC